MIECGIRKDNYISKWYAEKLETLVKRVNDSMVCVRYLSRQEDLNELILDCEKVIECARLAKKALKSK